MPPGKREDPMEKLARMMDERIAAAFEGQDRKAKEEKDPWARLEGAVSRAVEEAVNRRFDALSEQDKRRAGKPKGDDDDGEDGETFKLGILGM